MDTLDVSRYQESNRLEAKAAGFNLPRSLWETYSSFANTSGGLILLGVEERGRRLSITGVSNPEKLLDDFWNGVNNPRKVSANILVDDDVEVVELEGKRVIAIRVPRADRRLKPVFVDYNPLTGTYRRNHTGDYHCTFETVRAMMRDASEESMDSRVIEHMKIDELDEDTLRRYRNRYKQFNENHIWANLPDDEFLCRIGAACRTDEGIVRPTGAGALMFGQDWRITSEFPNYFLDYREQRDPTLRWEDRITSQGGLWSGNAYDFYFRVYPKLAQALKVPFKLEGISRIDDTPAHKALREALVNCLTNADYYGRRGLVAVWTPDKIELANPGGFRVDVDKALTGGISDPRNATMLKIFSFVEIGERAGSGLPKICDGWTSCGYEAPMFEESFDPDRMTLTLSLKKQKEAAKTGRKNRPKKPAEKTNGITMAQENEVLALLRAEGSAGRSAFVEALGVGPSRVKDILSGMVEKRLIVPEGAGRARVYRLPDDAGE